jgi:hypothetical protein
MGSFDVHPLHRTPLQNVLGPHRLRVCFNTSVALWPRLLKLLSALVVGLCVVYLTSFSRPYSGPIYASVTFFDAALHWVLLQPEATKGNRSTTVLPHALPSSTITMPSSSSLAAPIQANTARTSPSSRWSDTTSTSTICPDLKLDLTLSALDSLVLQDQLYIFMSSLDHTLGQEYLDHTHIHTKRCPPAPVAVHIVVPPLVMDDLSHL